MTLTPISVRLKPEIKQILVTEAKAETRSVSSLITKILVDWASRRPKTKHLGQKRGTRSTLSPVVLAIICILGINAIGNGARADCSGQWMSVVSS